MILESIGVVSAGYDEAYEEYIKVNCTALYDVWCFSTSGSASTWVYVDSVMTSVEATASLYLYVIDKSYSGIEDETIKENLSTLGDYDTVTSFEINSGLVTADAEVNISSDKVGWKAESEHSVDITVGSNSCSDSICLYAYK